MSHSILIYFYAVGKTIQNHPSAFGHILSLSLLGLFLSELSLDVLMVFIIYQNPHFGNAIELEPKFTNII